MVPIPQPRLPLVPRLRLVNQPSLFLSFPLPRQVSLLFDGDGQWYRGEVVGWDGRRGRALLLYDDGEDEWVELEQEALTWHCQLAGHSGVYPGLRGGEWALAR